VAYQNVTTPLVSKNGVNYNLQYDSNNGNVQVIQSTVVVGSQPVFKDGFFTATGKRTFDEAEQDTLYRNISSSIRGAYTRGGGNSRSLVLPQWARPENQSPTAGQTSITPQIPPTGNQSSTAANIATTIGTVFQGILNAGSTINQLNNQDLYGYVGESLAGGALTYPIDMRIDQQDTLSITQFRYNAPAGGVLTGGGGGNILKSGITRGSDFIGSSIEGLGTVHLPMPNVVTDSNNVAWGDETMNNIAASITSTVMSNPGPYATAALGGQLFGQGVGSVVGTGMYVIDQLRKGGFDGDAQQLGAAMAASQIIKRTTGAQVEAETILARGAGVVANNNLELLFNSPALRSFSFDYKMTARSEQEAKAIRGILNYFKKGMAVKKVTAGGGSNFFLRTPNVFRLQYRSGGSENKSLNKFKTCALTSFTCNYTPDGFWAAYDRGQPVSISMNMRFGELDPIFDTDYQGTGDSIGY
jgi:hypothetical protein